MAEEKKTRGRKAAPLITGRVSQEVEGAKPIERTPAVEPPSGTPRVIERRDQVLPMWETRSQALRENHTTPRDLFATDWAKIDAPDEVKKNVRFLWMSEIIIRKRPILPGFAYEIYQPVTEDVMKQFQIKVHTNDRTPEGVPKAGMDAILYWAPEDMAKQQDDVFLEGSRVAEMMARRQKEHSGSTEGAIGSIVEGLSQGDIAKAQEEQREALGTPIG